VWRRLHSPPPGPQRPFTRRVRGVRWSNARCVKRPCPPSNTDNTTHTRTPLGTHLRPQERVKTSAVMPSALLLIAPSAWSPTLELRRCSCLPPRSGTQWTLALMGVACGTHGPPPHIHRGLYDRGSHHATHLPTPLGPDAKTRRGASAPPTARPPTAWTPARHSKREAETACGGGQAGQGSIPLLEGVGAVGCGGGGAPARG
jgi:hypothetical protein